MPDRESFELDMKFYNKHVKQPLLGLGGVYVSKGMFWQFDFDPTSRIDEFKSGFKTNLSNKFHFFETPIELAGSMFQFAEESGIKWWELVNVSTAKALEPSAGRGKLIQRLFVQGFNNVSYYENMPENREVLNSFNYYGKVPYYLGDDFMRGKEHDFDICLANPPFRHEFKHIAQMFKVLKPGGVLLSLSSPKLYSSDKFIELLQENSSCWGMRELHSDKENPIFNGTNIGCTVIAAVKKRTTLF